MLHILYVCICIYNVNTGGNCTLCLKHAVHLYSVHTGCSENMGLGFGARLLDWNLGQGFWTGMWD